MSDASHRRPRHLPRRSESEPGFDVDVRFEPGGDARAVAVELRGWSGEGACRDVVGATLDALEVRHGRIALSGTGAPPWVVAARVESAVRRAGLARPRRALSAVERPLPENKHRERRRRSRLYVPGDRPKFMVRAAEYRPDAIILDLEDGVHASRKDDALDLIRSALVALDFGDAERMVRINAGARGLDDLGAVVPLCPDVIVIPKVEHPDIVRELDRALGTDSGDPGRPPFLLPIVESALGVEHAFDIARSSERIVALALGIEDYTASIGAVRTRSGDESAWARSRIVNAARAAGVQPVDSVYGDIDDLEGLGEWAHRSRAAGFEGMGCIHPRQVPVVHGAFAPTRDEVDRARRIVAAFEEGESRGRGVVRLGSTMIDAPVARRARRLLDRASEARNRKSPRK